MSLGFRERAEADFDVAEFLHAAGKDPAAVCFHAQQCIEKLIKAAIAKRGGTPARTHDLIALSGALSRLEPDWKADPADLAILAPAAVD